MHWDISYAVPTYSCLLQSNYVVKTGPAIESAQHTFSVNPVSFRFHDPGWDSVAQMNLICRLEETFRISIKGRETMRIKSYRDGLELVKKKLAEAAGGQ